MKNYINKKIETIIREEVKEAIENIDIQETLYYVATSEVEKIFDEEKTTPEEIIYKGVKDEYKLWLSDLAKEEDLENAIKRAILEKLNGHTLEELVELLSFKNNKK